ncbi:hypothetical protein AB0D33_01350 [Streptomyces sp. NPDC048404]
MIHRIRAITLDVLEGLRAGIDVLLWGQAYPQTYAVPGRTDDARP